MDTITEERAKELILNYGMVGWFAVEFVKKNGDVRKMTCRLNVKRHLKGGELKYNPSEKDLIIAWCNRAKDYRSINLKTLRKLKINKQEYAVEHG